MNTLSVTVREIADLKPHPNNARMHSARQLRQLAASITRFGFTNPALVDQDDRLIAGHGRVEAAKLLGMTEVPVIRLTDLSAAEVRAYMLADNKLAENSAFDKELLRVELAYQLELDADFDPEPLGFDPPEIDALVLGATTKPTKADRLDKVPQPEKQIVTRAGDIWLIGEHRLSCNDALLASTYSTLMGAEKATMIFSDPPFNLPIGGHVSGLGEVQHPEFAMASGEMSSPEFAAFLFKAFSNQAAVSKDGSIHFQCIDWRHLEEMMMAGRNAYHEVKNICVWSKQSGGMGSLYRSAHEIIFVFKYGTAQHINNVELGKHGRYRTNVWHYPGANSFGATRNADLAMHPTVKPVAMVADAIMDCSRRKDIVLDGFAGSGTTLVAAQKTKRRGFGIEIDPGYCDTIVRRMYDLFKLEAKLMADGRTFEEVAAERMDNVRQEPFA